MIKGSFKLPYAEHIRKDHELQIFVALVICFGGVFNVAIWFIIGNRRLCRRCTGQFLTRNQVIQYRLESFKVVFVALFFVSVGMLVNLSFIAQLLKSWRLSSRSSSSTT